MSQLYIHIISIFVLRHGLTGLRGKSKCRFCLFFLSMFRVFSLDDNSLLKLNITEMALEGLTKRTEHHGYSIGIYLQEQRMVTRT